MLFQKYTLAAIAFMLLFSACSEYSSPNPVAKQSRQLLMVISANDTTHNARMAWFERPNADEQWHAVTSSFDVVLGHAGLAWGKGLHEIPPDGVQKVEGDGKSTAGTFLLGEAFGFADPDSLPPGQYPYVQITEDLECVDDPYSRSYNQVVHRDSVNEDWASSELMIELPVQYKWGVVVKHNMNPVKAGDGSCIFLHVWRDSATATLGCTAMPEKRMKEMLSFLKRDTQPVLVQLTEADYLRFKQSWQLPDMP